MYYPDEIIEEIRSKVDIVDVVSSYVKIQKKGSNYFGLCPFHSEKSPSFSVSQPKQMFHCFGCGVSGNVYTFVMKYENYSFGEAVELLAQRAGVTLPKAEYSKEAKIREDKREKLLAANKEAAKYFYYQLRAPQGKKGLEYLKGRGLSDGIMKQFGLGYANINANDLTEYLKSKGYNDEILTEAGLSTFDEKYGMHDKFWNRVIFPIQDINHRVIGFGGRVMGDAKPKYLNSQETIIFDKGRNLYGLNFARSSRTEYLILCEGYMDVIAMHSAGFNMAVASLGTAFTTGQANLIRRYAKEVLLAYDSDDAGIKAALRAIAILREVDLGCRIISLEPYKDPDELIKAMGGDELEKRIENAENSFFFELRILSRDYNLNDPEGKTRFHREIAKKLCEFGEDVERENYIEAVAEKYNIGFDNLRKLVLSYAASQGDVKEAFRPVKTKRQVAQSMDAIKRPQKLFLTYLIDEPYLYKQIKEYVSPDDFTEDMYKRAAERLFDDLERGEVNPAAIISMYTDEAEQTEVASLFNTKLPELSSAKDKEKAFHDILYQLKKISYEHFAQNAGSDADALTGVLEAKKALDKINKLSIKMED